MKDIGLRIRQMVCLRSNILMAIFITDNGVMISRMVTGFILSMGLVLMKVIL